MIRLRFKVAAVLTLVVVVVGYLHIKHPIPSVTLPVGRTDESKLNLPDYGHGDIITVKRRGNTEVTTVTPKVTGFPFDVGLSYAVGSGVSALYLTTEIYYYRHMELLAGVGVTYPVTHPNVMVAVGYRLPYKRVDNVSLFVGHDLQSFIAGAYIRFGSN
jgi:hypothetical protein